MEKSNLPLSTKNCDRLEMRVFLQVPNPSHSWTLRGERKKKKNNPRGGKYRVLKMEPEIKDHLTFWKPIFKML